MLKSFDFFRKIQTDQELTSATGGLFTLAALTVRQKIMQAAAILILFSLQDFYQEKYYTFLSIKNDESEFLPMKIDILFFNLPCEGISHNSQLSQLSLRTNLSMSNTASKTRLCSTMYPREKKQESSIREARIDRRRRTTSKDIWQRSPDAEQQESFPFPKYKYRQVDSRHSAHWSQRAE